MDLRRLDGPCAWHGAELARSGGWVHELSAAEIGEIDAALDHARSRGLEWPSIERDDFPLPRLGPRLDAIRDALEHGPGIALLRGLPVARYADEDLRVVFTGIGRHVGTPVFQNAIGERMRAITDEGPGTGARYGELQAAGGGTFLSSRARVASTGELRFHTDRTDVVALLCVHQARAGALSRVASSVAVHNAMLDRHPDLLAELHRPYPRSRLGEETGGDRLWYMLPVMGIRDGAFTSHYSRTYVEAAQLVEGVPKLTDRQWQAIDCLAETAAELCLERRFEPGDVQLLNSHVTYHARTAYEDDPGARRLLYRLWLSPPGNRALPADHAVLWRHVEANTLRGGIEQAA